jgi:multidrug efflux system membrane fusion protein
MRMTLVVAAAAALAQVTSGAPAAEIETTVVRPALASDVYVSDGVVEAVRQTVIAAQVAGRITELRVKAGDVVKAGQTLARVDERTAAQQVAASQAQVAAAQAQLEAAQREFARSQRLFAKKYISQAAMDQAESQYKAIEAQVRALLAQASVATTQTLFHTLQAPYSGVVAEVSCELGDLATPGKPLMKMYDPAALRAVVDVPESQARSLVPSARARLEFPGVSEALRWQTSASMTVLPTADPASHTVQVRLPLPTRIAGLAPGMYARAHLPVLNTGAAGRLSIPAKAVITHTELHAVYVIGKDGRAQLRQVRLGRSDGERVEVLAGLADGERIALDPVAAARMKP